MADVGLPPTTSPPVPGGHPYASELVAEHDGWAAVIGLVGRLTPGERLQVGYYDDGGWSVKDLVAHLGTWLAEAEVQLQRIGAGTYDGPPTDIDALNERFLAAMRDQPWSVVSTQAHAARQEVLRAWYALREPSPDAAWWIHKSGAEHYEQHLPRLAEWVDQLVARRSTAAVG